MAELDFFTGLLPFVLTYALIYLALGKVELFEDTEDRDLTRYRAVVAIIFAFFAAYYFVMNPVYQEFFTGYLSRILVGIIGLLGLLVFLQFIPGFDWGDSFNIPLVIGVLTAVLFAFILSGGSDAFVPFELSIPMLGVQLSEVVDVFFDSGLIYLLIIGGALYWVTKPGNEENDTV